MQRQMEMHKKGTDKRIERESAIRNQLQSTAGDCGLQTSGKQLELIILP